MLERHGRIVRLWVIAINAATLADRDHRERDPLVIPFPVILTKVRTHEHGEGWFARAMFMDAESSSA